MPVDEIVIAAAAGEPVAAFYEAGAVVRVELGSAAADRRVGEVVLGRVQRVEPGLAAAFVDLGGAETGFLNRADAAGGGGSARLPAEGDVVLVQIAREAEPGKSARLTGTVVLPGRAVIHCPCRPGIHVSRRLTDADERLRLLGLGQALPIGPGGWFLRAAAARLPAERLADEAARLLATWQRLQQLAAAATAPARLWRPPDPLLAAIGDEAGPALRRIVADDPGILASIRAHLPELGARLRLAGPGEAAAQTRVIDAEIEAMLAPSLGLPGGGTVHVAETAALVAIDVDAGSHRAGGGEETALAVNLEAVAVVVREIRRRELAGHIVVDFVAMRRKAHRERVLEALRAAFAGDRLETHVAGYTRLGTVELSRRRVRASLRSRLCVPCRSCRGSGAGPAPEHVARRGLQRALHDLHGASAGVVGLVAGPAVAAALRGPVAPAVAAVEARLGRRLVVREDPLLAADAVHVDMDRAERGTGGSE